MAARGPLWPCALGAAQRLPVTVTLRLDATRWCAAFGGTVAANVPGRFRARGAAAPPACPASGPGIASLNVLHGLFCPLDTANCRYAERMALVRDWVAARGCPDVVGLQEVLEAQVPILTQGLATLCGGYAVVYTPANRFDDAMLWTRVPVVAARVEPLLRGFRNVLITRLDHPAGPLDVLVTHLASGSDGGGAACGADCPAACVAAGAATVRDCQAVQVAAFAAESTAAVTLVAGDFNAPPGSFVHATLTAHGAWADSHLAARLAECDRTTGIGCTSGRDDDVLDDLESPALNERSRIDYVVLAGPPGGACAVEPAGDPDGDGVATRLFADLPNPFAPACGPAPAPICWPSDHVGVQADVVCR
ncbi:MAG: endonuclease/exonuclease/phosphatase family protein [bacterium]|nr:endonuclease/exonuclease/phosphatase family protein [bacterium]